LKRRTENIGKHFQPDQHHAMKWSGAIGVEMELVLVEGQSGVTNTRKQGEEFHKGTENK